MAKITIKKKNSKGASTKYATGGNIMLDPINAYAADTSARVNSITPLLDVPVDYGLAPMDTQYPDIPQYKYNDDLYDPTGESLGYNTNNYTRRGYMGNTPEEQNTWVTGETSNSQNIKDWYDPESSLNKGVQWRQDAINEIKTKQPKLYEDLMAGNLSQEKLNSLLTESKVGPMQSLVQMGNPSLKGNNATPTMDVPQPKLELANPPVQDVPKDKPQEGDLPEDPLKKFTSKSPEWMRYAGIAGNLAGFIPNKASYASPTTMSAGLLNPQLVDEQTMRANIDAANRANVGALSNVTGGSGAAQRAAMLGQGSNYMDATSNAFLQANAVNNQARQSADQFNISNQGNIAAQNMGVLNQFELENKQLENDVRANNRARAEQAIKGIAGEFADIGEQNYRGNILNNINDFDTRGNYQWAQRANPMTPLNSSTANPLLNVPQPSTKLMPFKYGGKISLK